MRNREIFGLAVVSTAAVIFALAAPSFGQQNQGLIPPPPGQGVPNPGQAQGKGKGKGKRAPSRPTPHGPDGHVLLGPLPGEKGVWNGNAGATIATNVGRGLDNNLVNLPTNLKIPDVPFQDWARAMYDSRQGHNNTADDPHSALRNPRAARVCITRRMDLKLLRSRSWNAFTSWASADPTPGAWFTWMDASVPRISIPVSTDIPSAIGKARS